MAAARNAAGRIVRKPSNSEISDKPNAKLVAPHDLSRKIRINNGKRNAHNARLND